MATIIVKPTDQSDPGYQTELATYNSQIDGIRNIASPDLSVQFAETQLPESLIGSMEYLGAAEREVLRESGIAAADVPSQSADRREILVYLVQLRVAIKLISQLPQETRRSVLSQMQQELAEIDWEERIAKLEAIYLEELAVINPAAAGTQGTIPVTGTTTESSEINFDVPYYSRTELYGRTP